MSERTLEQILAEWRECERAHDAEPSLDLARRIEALRIEHAAAIAARQDQADELAELTPFRFA